MNATQILIDEIDTKPSVLVDYADENEIGEVYAAIYNVIRNPVDSDQYQDAEAFLQRHIMNAVERYKAQNNDRANERVTEYFNSLQEAA